MNNLYTTPQIRTSYSQMLASNRMLSKRKISYLSLLIIVSLLTSTYFSVAALKSSGIPNTNSQPKGLNSLIQPKSTSDSPKLSGNVTGTAVSSTNTDPNSRKNCTPTKSYAKPSTPTADSRSNSVNQSQTIISYYKVYGKTPNEISNQIYSCTPVTSNGKKFAASTNYAINWSILYSPVKNSQSHCRVISAGVGLSISKVFPAWEATTNTSASTKNTWNAFIANLKQHENEHQAINQMYATKLLNELNKLAPTNCNTISDVAKVKAQSVIASLDAANIRLDATTDHGATDGAKLY